MAIPKVCGIETEYGILVRGSDSNPVSASSLLINAYLSSTHRKVTWDFEDERPGSEILEAQPKRGAVVAQRYRGHVGCGQAELARDVHERHDKAGTRREVACADE